MAAKINDHLADLLYEEAPETLVSLDRLDAYMSNFIVKPIEQMSLTRGRTNLTQNMNQFHVNEFYTNLPLILYRLFP